jgi:hypothetical protein
MQLTRLHAKRSRTDFPPSYLSIEFPEALIPFLSPAPQLLRHCIACDAKSGLHSHLTSQRRGRLLLVHLSLGGFELPRRDAALKQLIQLDVRAPLCLRDGEVHNDRAEETGRGVEEGYKRSVALDRGRQFASLVALVPKLGDASINGVQ